MTLIRYCLWLYSTIGFAVVAIGANGQEQVDLDSGGLISNAPTTSTQEKTSCSNPNDYLCLDFESTKFQNIALGSNVIVDDKISKSGNRSIHFKTNNNNDGSAQWYGGFVKTLHPVPGTHWGRLYYKIEDIANPADYTHITFAAASTPVTDVRLVDTVRGPQGTHQYLYNFPDDKGGMASSYDWQFDDQWVCVEWYVDFSKQTYQFYREGELVSQISGNVANDHGGIPEQFKTFYFGGQVYQKGPEVTGWLDDIVLSKDRRGC